ncbi:MAG TPA: ankyrin repeat domain-containing protein [Archangium sp.]
MAKKPTKKTLPKELDALLDVAAKSGDEAPVREALEACLPDARGGYGKGTILMNKRCTLELAKWAIARGTDVNAGDTWGATPLHEAARSRFFHVLQPEQLIAVGADVNRTSNEGLTPLHAAADGKNDAAVKVLLAHGADVHARERSGRTALEYALGRMSNIDLVAMVDVAKTLLAAGAEVSKEAQAAVKRAAETFEFHRSGFAKDSVEETSAACAALCALFGVETPAPRRMHDGRARIEVEGATHASLWSSLVPSSGAAATVQGEVIRVSGRLARELLGNGAANWDADFAAMAKVFVAYLSSERALEERDLSECREIVRAFPGEIDRSERLMHLAVEWVRRNPEPVALTRPEYRR